MTQSNVVHPVNVAIVPDSFKGSARASEVAAAIADGVQAAANSVGRDVAITAVPFADGGEGTLDALTDAWGTEPQSVQTTDALGRAVSSRFGLSADGTTAVIEAAEAAGLPQVSDVPRQPLKATTFGLGALVTQALDLGVQKSFFASVVRQPQTEEPGFCPPSVRSCSTSRNKNWLQAAACSASWPALTFPLWIRGRDKSPGRSPAMSPTHYWALTVPPQYSARRKAPHHRT